MSRMSQGLHFSSINENNELFGNSKQTFGNDLKSSGLQTRRKIKFVSSIDHYSTLHRLAPPNFNLSLTTAPTPNLPPASDIKSNVEFQALSVDHYSPQFANIPPSLVAGTQSSFYSGTNEIGFSSLYSLEYAFPDYRDFESKSFEQLSSENVTVFQPQLHLKQSIASEHTNPYFPQNYVQQTLLMQEQLHNLQCYPPLPNRLFNAKEADNFDYRCSTLGEPTCLNSNGCVLPPFQKYECSASDSSEKSKSFFDQSKPVSVSGTSKMESQKKLLEEKHVFSNFTPEKPGSSVTLKNNLNYTSHDFPSDIPGSEEFKNETLSKSDYLTSPNDIKATEENVSNGENSNSEVWNENQNTGEFNNCRTNFIRDTETSLSSPLKVNAIKTNLKPSSSKYSENFLNLEEFEPNDLKNVSVCSVREKNLNFSESSVLSCKPIDFAQGRNFSPDEEPEFETRRETLPVECDSTTESDVQPTDLIDQTKSLLSALNDRNPDTQRPSSDIFEPDLNDPSSLEGADQLMKPNKCRICKESLFTERPSLQELTVPIDSNFDVCNACNICFLQKSVLNTNSGDEENPHKCIYCDRRFKKECYLILHIRIHTTEKPHKCSECKKSFANSAKLKLHFKTHTNDKPFVCKECDRRFVQNSHLKMHSRVHLDNKSFKCNSCMKDFASRSRLVEHEKYHSPKLPFKCATCEKSFVKETYYESHLRIHCNAKPFECITCNTFFPQKSVLRQHTKNCRFELNSKIYAESVTNQDSRLSSIEG